VLEQFLAAVRIRRRPPPALGGRSRLLALPAPPGAEHGPVCQACGYRHPPVRGLAPTWSTPIDGSDQAGRPRPLRDDPGADVVALYRDQFNPWRP
jgi:hypothetical protein